MSQPLRVAGFELIISGRFWVIAKDKGFIGGPDRDRTDDLFHAILTAQTAKKL
jgi:hypothetical protein